MEYEGKLLRVSGDEITFKLDKDFDIAQAHRLVIDDVPRAHIRMIDERNMTIDQNAMIHGLFNDFSLYTGYPQEYVKELFKSMFAGYKGIESFSMANLGISQVFAGEFIEYLLGFFFAEQIPFKYQKFHLGSDITRVLFLYLKHRICFVCGKPHADMAHYEAVGMGRNRKTIDHSRHRFMALCREHHQEQHTIGLTEFMSKYVLVPIKLTPEQIKEFKIGG